MPRLLAAATALLVCLGFVSGAALAHSALKHSTPADGATLKAAPAELELLFNERVQVTAVRVYVERGAELKLPDARTIDSGERKTVRLPSLAPGTYRVEWRAISADGHAVRGTIRFRVEGGA